MIIDCTKGMCIKYTDYYRHYAILFRDDAARATVITMKKRLFDIEKRNDSRKRQNFNEIRPLKLSIVLVNYLLSLLNFLMSLPSLIRENY